MKKTLVSWSSGKDSAWLVHRLRERPDIDIGALLSNPLPILLIVAGLIAIKAAVLTGLLRLYRMPWSETAEIFLSRTFCSSSLARRSISACNRVGA